MFNSQLLASEMYTAGLRLCFRFYLRHIKDMLHGAEQSQRIKQLKELYSKRHRARYRHGIGRPAGNLYYSIRKLLKLNQTDAGKLIGITRQAWQYRERTKVMYWPLEIAMLKEIAGLTDAEFIQLLNDIA